MEVLFTLLGSLSTALAALLVSAWIEPRRRDRQIARRDEKLEEWLVTHHRQLKQQWNDLDRQARADALSAEELAARRVAVQTTMLYEYREELRRAQSFVLDLAVEEGRISRLARWLSRRPLRALQVPARAERLIDFWEEGTARNALTWSLNDILDELPARTPSRARIADH